MVAQLLKLSGLFLGDETDMWGPTTDNPEGHWEHIRLSRINEEILNILGGGWDCPPAMPEHFSQEGPFRALAAEARAIERDCFSDRSWGWKDPRNSLTFPFWHGLWPSLKTVICLRNPLEVAVSLRRRGFSSYAFGLSLWKIYNTRLLKTVPPTQRMVTHYEAYFADPKAELRRLIGFLELPISEGALEECCAGARFEHRHNCFTTKNLLEAGVSSELVQLYLSLCAEAGWQASSTVPKDIAPVGDLGEQSRLPAIGPALLDLDLSRRELQTMRARLAETTEQAKRAMEIIVERDKTIETLKAALPKAEAEALRAAELQRALESQNLRIDALADRIERVLRLQTDQDYRKLVRVVTSTVRKAVPPRAKVLVVSKGDPALLKFNGRAGWHFPREPDGTYSGHHPTDSNEAIANLEALRQQGAQFLVVPSTALWWLDHYTEFRRHLEGRYFMAGENTPACRIFDLRACKTHG